MITFIFDKSFDNIKELKKLSAKYKATVIIREFAVIKNGEIIYFN